MVPLVSGASGVCWATQMPGGDGGHHRLDVFMHSFGNKERHVGVYSVYRIINLAGQHGGAVARPVASKSAVQL